MLKLNQKAPPFTLPDQEKELQSLKDHLGSWLVIYFYPKDDTPGCTTEACVIAEVYQDFKKLGVKVFGVSKDTPGSHKKFAEKYNLPFTLLSDPTMEMMDKYGAFVEKQMYGKVVRGTKRISYLINKAGKVAKIYPEVDPATHAHVILKDFKILIQAEQKK